MAMELLTFHYQFVAHLAADDENDNLIPLDIIQCTQISRSQLERSERIWVWPDFLADLTCWP
jgi:hypothetical protein